MQLLKKSNTLFHIALSYASLLTVRSKKIYVFGAWGGNKFSDNPKYLYLEACKDDAIQAVWITRSKAIYNTLKKRGYPVHMYNSPLGIYYQSRAAVYFTCMSKQDVFSPLLSSATRVNLWHGVGLKKILNDDTITVRKKQTPRTSLKARFWKRLNAVPRKKAYLLSTSDTMTDIFSAAFKKPKAEILQFGQPRNDVFYRSDLEFEQFDFIDGTKKIFLYMPTHRKEGKEKMLMHELLDLPALNDFCAANNALFFIKKHYYHNHENDNLDAFPFIKDITRTDLDSQQLLKYADILLTDYSSCFVDFLLLDRPVIFYNYDYDRYVLNDRDLYFDYDTTTPGEKAKTFSQLLQALQNTMHLRTDHFRAERERVKNIFYAPDNQQPVGKKILNFVKSLP